MRRTKIQIEKDSRTFSNLGYAIKKHGIDKVREEVYQERAGSNTNEQVALNNWINTRMYRQDIQDRLETLSN